MKSANTFREGKNRQIPIFILPLALILLLGFPVRGQAAWTDGVDGNIQQIINNVNAIKSQMKEVFDTIKDAKDEITDGKVKAMISDVRVMLQEAVNHQQAGVNDFLLGGSCVVNDGTPCGFFRADLIFYIQTVNDISNQLLAMHNVPALDIHFEDPGLAEFLDKVPGRLLYPLYRIMTKTKLLDAGFLAALGQIPTHLANAKLVLYPDPSAIPTSLSTLTAASGISIAVTVPTPSNSCQLIEGHPLAFNIAKYYLTGVGALNKIIGKILDAMGETFVAGPAEADAGIHGYVHGTIKTDTLAAMGKIASNVGESMQAIGQALSGKIDSCALDAQLATIIHGQKEILCAMKNNNLAGCEEFIGNGFDNHGVGGNNGTSNGNKP